MVIQIRCSILLYTSVFLGKSHTFLNVSYCKRCNVIQLVTLFWLCIRYSGMPHAFLYVGFRCERCILLDLVMYKVSQEGPIPS